MNGKRRGIPAGRHESANTGATGTEKKVVYIDADCRICRFFGRLLESADKGEEFTVAPISPVAPEYGRNIMRDEIQLEEEGATRHGADAVLAVLAAFRFVGYASLSPGRFTLSLLAIGISSTDPGA
jgi:hypothetical protein